MKLHVYQWQSVARLVQAVLHGDDKRYPDTVVKAGAYYAQDLRPASRMAA